MVNKIASMSLKKVCVLAHIPYYLNALHPGHAWVSKTHAILVSLEYIV